MKKRQAWMGLTKGAIVTSAILAALSVPAFAEEEKAPGSGPNPFSDCGIGAALFPNTAWAAVTSNVIWDVGTTAVISATASPETCSGSNVKAAQFIIDTYDNLVEETAQGEGVHVATLLNIYGCSEQQQNTIVGNLRGSIASQLSSEGYDSKSQLTKASDYYDEVSVAAASCSA